MAKCRKVLAMLVSLVMVFSLFGLSAFAAEAEGECTLTVNFVGIEGNPIQNPEVTVYPIGSMYEVAAPAIEGHGFDHAEGETSGILEGDTVVTLVYVAMDVESVEIPEVDPPLADLPDEAPPLSDDPALAGMFTVTVHYKDTDGNVIREAEVQSYQGAALYEISATALDGYGFAYAEGETSGIITEDVDVTLVYEKFQDADDLATLEDGETPLAAAPEVPSDNSPATGETIMAIVWIVLLVASAIGLFVVLKGKGKRKGE